MDRVHLKNKEEIKAALSTIEALAGDRTAAAADAKDALRDSKRLSVMSTAGIALALLRDPKAATIADEILRTHPNDSMAVNSNVPQIRAVIALFPPNSAKPNPARAIDLLNTAALYARANAGVFFGRGLAYEMSGRYSEAQQDFQKVVDFSHRSSPDILYSYVQVELGRVYQKQGNIPQARIAYQNFLAAWKDADPNLPLLREAKAEYAKLQ
jgi:tetratricopeptide (TPR) repeat protein